MWRNISERAASLRGESSLPNVGSNCVAVAEYDRRNPPGTTGVNIACSRKSLLGARKGVSLKPAFLHTSLRPALLIGLFTSTATGQAAPFRRPKSTYIFTHSKIEAN